MARKGGIHGILIALLVLGSSGFAMAQGAIDGRLINDLNGNAILDTGEGFLRDPSVSCAGTAVSALAGVLAVVNCSV